MSTKICCPALDMVQLYSAPIKHNHQVKGGVGLAMKILNSKVYPGACDKVMWFKEA